MFKNIAVAYITPTKKMDACYHGLSLAKNYDSKLTLMGFFVKETPKLFFFETKNEKSIGKIRLIELQVFAIRSCRKWGTAGILLQATQSTVYRTSS